MLGTRKHELRSRVVGGCHPIHGPQGWAVATLFGLGFLKLDRPFWLGKGETTGTAYK